MTRERLWTGKYSYLVLLNTLNCFSFYMIVSILTTLLTDMGIGLSLAGAVVGLFSVTSLVVRPFVGYLVDRCNKKRILMTGSFLIAAALVGYILTDCFGLILVCRVLHGAAFAVNGTAILAFASEFIPEGRLGEGIGYVGLGNIVASAVGPGFGVFLMEQWGIRATFLIAAGFSLVCGIGMACFPYAFRRTHPERVRGSVRWKSVIAKELLPYAFVGGIYSFMGGIISAFLVLYAKERGIENVSIYFTVCAVFLFLARPVSGKLTDRRGLPSVIYPSVLLSVISVFLLVHAKSLGMVLASAVLRSIAQGAAQPSLQAACIKRLGVEKSGVATSTFYLGSDVGQGLGPVLGGMVAEATGYSAVFYLCAVLMVAAGVVYGIFDRTGNEVREHEKG